MGELEGRVLETTASQSSVSKAPRLLPEKLWRCDCGSEVLGVSFYTWRDDPPDWFIEVYKASARYSWRWRLKTIRDLLVGREVVIDAVSLDREKASELIAFLRDSIAEVTEPTSGIFTGVPSTITYTGGSAASQKTFQKPDREVSL